MKIDVAALRASTQKAIEEGKARKELEKRAQEEYLALERKENEVKAAKVLATVSDKCQEAAARGASKAHVLRLTREDYYTADRPVRLADTHGYVRLVIDALLDAGLHPYLEYAWDGGGWDSWYDLFIRWDIPEGGPEKTPPPTE